ncbi:MAG: hypothetical protein NUV69_04545 [Candidatus Curtissbacteria bacterium]|nr:hypothetical protein [Candidatus Curtissbacteria bacterium]
MKEKIGSRNTIISLFKMKKLYLDIDGVILNKDLSPANHLKEFLERVLPKYDVYFLTTHCKGDAEYTLNYLSRLLDQEIIELLKTVKPTTFDRLKTEGIDFNSEFIWLDDYLFDSEIAELEKHGAKDSWIKADLKNDPDFLKHFIQGSVSQATPS